jgi:hypothetical protein
MTASTPLVAPLRPRLRRTGVGLRSPRLGLWWLTPAGAFMLIIPAALGLALLVPARDYVFVYGTPKDVDGNTTVLMLIASGIMVAASLIPLARIRPQPSRPWPDLTERQLDIVVKAARICFWVTLVGYASYLVSGLARGASPLLLVQVLVEQSNFGDLVKQDFVAITGVTSLTQVGMAFVTLDCVVLCSSRRTRTAKRQLAIILTLAVLRSFWFDERLAMLEVVIPALAFGAGPVTTASCSPVHPSWRYPRCW